MRPSAVTHPQALTVKPTASVESIPTFKSLSINIRKNPQTLTAPFLVGSGISSEVYVYIDRLPEMFKSRLVQKIQSVTIVTTCV
ncbi:MAG: hypothetical protein F6K35_29690 [Okeania sp. SIO2H7]|nr:hypothetical protein [Okeania sp. SIO2H7]